MKTTRLQIILFLSSFLILLGLLSSRSLAEKKVPSSMYGFREAIAGLQPYLYSPGEFSNKKNKAQIEPHLRALQSLAKNLSHHKRLQTPGFSVPSKLMQDHLKNTYEEYQAGNRNYAYRMLRSGINGCSHCHAQVKTQSTPEWSFKGQKLSKDPLHLAEFWFLMRDYDRALDFYHSVLARTEMDEKKSMRVHQALDRVLTIGLRIKRSPETTQRIFKSLDRAKSLPPSVTHKLNLWKADLKELLKLPTINLKTVSAQELDAYATKNLGSIYPFFKSNEAKRPSMEYMAGILSEFANTQSKKLTPEILHWLGMINLEISHDLFFTVGEELLKECVIRFPGSKVAQDQCYPSLKQYWTQGFTGSAGTQIPDTYQRELDKLKKLIKESKPSKKA